jgi:uncharacterized protein (TIGR02594 family)
VIAVSRSTAAPHYSPWMAEAKALLGLKEVPGHIHEARIVSMWARLGLAFRDDETPWCAAYVGYCLEEAGFKSTRSASARSYLKWGRPVGFGGAFLWDSLPYGAVVVLDRPGSSWSGHVGFYAGCPAKGHVALLGGNQGNAVSVAQFPTTRVIGVRWADGLPLPPSPGAYAGPLEATLPTNIPLSQSEA